MLVGTDIIIPKFILGTYQNIAISVHPLKNDISMRAGTGNYFFFFLLPCS